MRALSMRTAPLLALGMIVLLVVAGANLATGSAKGSTERPKKQIVVGFANLIEGVPVLAAMRTTIQAYAKKRGWGFIALNNNFSGPTALQNAETMINKKVTFAIEFQADASVQPIIMSKFNKAHIPVVAIDIAAPGAYFVGAPNLQSGNQAGIALGLYAKKNWACNPDLVMLLDAPIAGIVSQLRVGSIAGGIEKICPFLNQKTIVQRDGGGTADSALSVARDILTANPNAKRILVSGINDVSATGAINAAEQLGRADQLYAWGQDGGVLLTGKADPHLGGSVVYFLEGYAAYIFPKILDKIAAGHRPPVGDNPASPNAVLVESCSLSAAQAKKIPALDQRVKALLSAKSGTTEAQRYCPKKAK